MASTMSRRKKRFTLAIASVLTLAGVGAAFAFWTSSGTGDGSASTGESVTFTLTSEPAVGTIYPGGPGQTIDFTVTNPGPGAQTLTSVSVEMASSTGTPWVPPVGCDVADYSATITAAPAVSDLAAGGTAEGTATVTLDNTGVNQDACQGEEVPLYFEAS